jgi:hypothetical protein
VVGADLFGWIAANRYVRDLTPVERERYLLGQITESEQE